MLRNVQKVKINEVKVRADNQYTKDENEIKRKTYLIKGLQKARGPRPSGLKPGPSLTGPSPA